MSGRKDTEIHLDSDSSSVTGERILEFLSLPVKAGMLAFYTGKLVVKGGIAAGKSVVNAAKTYEEYRHQQEIKRKQMLEKRLQRELAEMTQMIPSFSALVQKMANQSLLKDFDYSHDLEFLDKLQKGDYSQTLDSVLGIKQSIQKRTQFLQDQDQKCQQICPQIQTLQNEIKQMTDLFRRENNLPDSSWPNRLEQFRSELENATISSFYLLQKRWANWKLEVVSKLKSLEIQTQARLELEALKHQVPCSPEEARKIDPTGYAELYRLEQHILSQTGVAQSANLQLILQSYRSTLERHLAIVVPELGKIEEQKKQQEAIWKKYAPQVEELENLLELAQTEVIKRWAESSLFYLQSQLESLKECCQKGDASNIELNLKNWREKYEAMLEDAGLQQRAAERREYIVQSLKTVLPELGFNIKSIQNESGTKSNTIIKVVPYEDSQKPNPRKITISIPQNEKESVQYRFESYDIVEKRENGQPIVKNDDGKITVQNIAKALEPFGIHAEEPDWKGNPDKIQKGALDFPDSAPEEEASWQQSESKRMEIDW